MLEQCFEEAGERHLYQVRHDVLDVVAVGDSGTKPRQVPSEMWGLHHTQSIGKRVIQQTSKRAAEKPLTSGRPLLRPRTSTLKVAIIVKLQGVQSSISISIMANLSSRSFILGLLSVWSLKSRLAALGQDTRMSTTMSSSLLLRIDNVDEDGMGNLRGAVGGKTVIFSTLGEAAPNTNWYSCKYGGFCAADVILGMLLTSRSNHTILYSVHKSAV